MGGCLFNYVGRERGREKKENVKEEGEEEEEEEGCQASCCSTCMHGRVREPTHGEGGRDSGRVLPGSR